MLLKTHRYRVAFLIAPMKTEYVIATWYYITLASLSTKVAHYLKKADTKFFLFVFSFIRQ